MNTNVPLAPKLRITLEQIARFGDRADGLFQTEFGGILGYKVADNVELGFGYRAVGAHNGNTADDENRLRQHVIATFGPVTTRFRIDERFSPAGRRDRFPHPSAGAVQSRTGADGLALFVSHESFYLPNSTRWGQVRGYERMRNILGVTVPVGRYVSADVGYLNSIGWRGGFAGADGSCVEPAADDQRRGAERAEGRRLST